MRLPNFLIIGAAKSGTTTLYEYLKEYTPLYLSPTKEPCFFARDPIYSQGLEWYRSLFKDAKPGQICGEASTDYTKCTEYPEAAKRIFNTIPSVKMIYIMRHPTERAYAHYRHMKYRNNPKVKSTFEKEIKEKSICLDASNYLIQIDKYLNFFPRESFLFLLMEDLIQEPEKTLNEILSFLNVESKIVIHPEETKIVNASKDFFEKTIRSKITKPLKRIPGLKTMANLAGQNFRNTIYEGLRQSYYGKKVVNENIIPPLTSETRKYLIEYFREPNEKLSQFLQRDLSHWNI